jgi:hypothetical protein
MIRAFALAKGMEPYARAAIDDKGKIVAVLVSYRVTTLDLLAPVASRSVQFAEPLCDQTANGVTALKELVAMHDAFMRSRALYGEVRTISEPGLEREALSANGYQYHEYLNFVVDLDNGRDVLWSRLKKNLRQKIRSSHRKGVVIRDDNPPEGIDRLYRMLQASFQHAKIPLPDQSLFTGVMTCLPQEWVRVRTAFLDQQPVASIISLAFGDRVFSWYGGTLRLPGLSPFACIVWDDIVWGAEHGFRYYDFGGAGWPDEDYGPRKFKAQFGGTELHYARCTRTYSKMRLRFAELGFDLSRRLGVWS